MSASPVFLVSDGAEPGPGVRPAPHSRSRLWRGAAVAGLLLLATVTTARHAPEPAAAANPDTARRAPSLYGTWILVRRVDLPDAAVQSSQRVDVTLSRAGLASGGDGCMSYRGALHLMPNHRLTISDMATSGPGCTAASDITAAVSFDRLFTDPITWSLRREELTLLRSDGAAFRFRQP